MVEPITDAPAPRKRGRPRNPTDEQQAPEVCACRATTEQVGADSRGPETSKAASRRAASISQEKRDHDRQSAISRTGTRVGHRRAQRVVPFLQQSSVRGRGSSKSASCHSCSAKTYTAMRVACQKGLRRGRTTCSPGGRTATDVSHV